MLDYVKLGGTLFIPATHKNLFFVVNKQKYKGLKSLVIDTEDSIAIKDVPLALKILQELLSSIEKRDILLFIRPRNLELLKEILSFKNIDKVDGFILAKCCLKNVDGYFNALRDTKHCIMPSIEGGELFHFAELQRLRDKFLPFKSRIPLVRFGLEDMLRQVSMRRSCDESIFDLSIGNSVMGNFLALFKSAGFQVSGGVYPCFKDEEGFIRDVKRDLKEGLFSKTIIHPKHIELINELYKVNAIELEEAKAIVSREERIFAMHDKMIETTTMFSHAHFILQRASVYGVR